MAIVGPAGFALLLLAKHWLLLGSVIGGSLFGCRGRILVLLLRGGLLFLLLLGGRCSVRIFVVFLGSLGWSILIARCNLLLSSGLL